LVYSEPGAGTTFKIYFPRVTTVADSPAPSSSAPVASSGSETILLVEDSGLLAKVTRDFLESEGYTVLMASNPREALHVADSFQSAIHLLLTDVVMPEMEWTAARRTTAGQTPRNESALNVGIYQWDLIGTRLQGG